MGKQSFDRARWNTAPEESPAEAVVEQAIDLDHQHRVEDAITAKLPFRPEDWGTHRTFRLHVWLKAQGFNRPKMTKAMRQKALHAINEGLKAGLSRPEIIALAREVIGW